MVSRVSESVEEYSTELLDDYDFIMEVLDEEDDVDDPIVSKLIDDLQDSFKK